MQLCIMMLLISGLRQRTKMQQQLLEPATGRLNGQLVKQNQQAVPK